ncbi:MAG TPA: site-specific integrase [Solirubrobacteraceae bacterium]|jgi:integrase|nr:site-specific integrase [Solirubrobacteraceae bacterium]
MAQRRAYGTGSLSVRTDRRGRESWYGRWYSDGHRVERRLGARRVPGGREGLTQKQAEAELRRQIDTATPTRPARDRLTLEEASERYIATLADLGRKRSTIVGVESIFRVWLRPHLGDRALNAIAPEDIDDLIATMRDAELSTKTIHNVIGALNALYRWALHPRRLLATSNPVELVEVPGKVGQPPIRFLTPDEVEAVVGNVVAGDYAELDRALYVTAAQAGLRQGELIALRWSDIDWKARRIRVERSHVLGEFDTPKSARSSRSVPMSSRVVAELKAWQKVTRWPGAKHLVFAEPVTGEPLLRNGIMRRWRKALAAAGVPSHRFHDLRHTFGTQAAGAGVALRTLQQWMGHATIATTMRYADYAPNAEETAMIERAFGGGTA